MEACLELQRGQNFHIKIKGKDNQRSKQDLGESNKNETRNF